MISPVLYNRSYTSTEVQVHKTWYTYALLKANPYSSLNMAHSRCKLFFQFKTRQTVWLYSPCTRNAIRSGCFRGKTQQIGETRRPKVSLKTLEKVIQGGQSSRLLELPRVGILMLEEGKSKRGRHWGVDFIIALDRGKIISIMRLSLYWSL